MKSELIIMAKRRFLLVAQLPTAAEGWFIRPAANGWEHLLVIKEEGDRPGHVAVDDDFQSRRQNLQPLGHGGH